jgi:hypothetical protein
MAFLNRATLGVGILLWLGLCLFGQAFKSPGVPAADEYHVKAVFLYNFAKFVEWPADSPAGPMCIGIIGDDPLGPELEQIVNGKTVNGRGFTVKRLKAETARTCQIVFVALSEKKRFKNILGLLKGAEVLTVGESLGFCESGGVINFEIVDSKVHFEVNLDAAERARLKLSSKLIGLAKIVRDGSN